MKFEELDIENLLTIDDRLKPVVKVLFNKISQEKTFYNEKILDKIANDLILGKFNIIVPNDIEEDDDTKSGLSGIDENEYIKTGRIQGRIIIFPCQLKKGHEEVLKTLSHEFEHYVCQSNESIARNIDFLKKKRFNMNSIMNDSKTSELPEIGGFCGNIMELKNGFDFYEEGSTEIVSSSVIEQKPAAYRNRISFLNGVLNAFGKNIDDMKTARRNGDINFLKDMIPEPFFQEIPALEILLRKKLGNKEDLEAIKKQLDKKLCNYIDFLYESSHLKKLPEEEQNLIIDNILETSIMGCSYKKIEYKRNSFARELSEMVNSPLKTSQERDGTKETLEIQKGDKEI